MSKKEIMELAIAADNEVLHSKKILSLINEMQSIVEKTLVKQNELNKKYFGVE